MPRDKFFLAQNLIGGSFGSVKISVECVEEGKLDEETFSVFDHARPLGISPGYSEKDGCLVALAISDNENCRIIKLKRPKAGKTRSLDPLHTILHTVLCRTAGELFAFDMAELALSLYFDLRLCVSKAVDIQSAFPKSSRAPIESIRRIIGGRVQVNAEVAKDTFRELIFRPNHDGDVDIATRAWVSQFLPTYENGAETLDKVARINTQDMAEEKIQMLSKLSADALRLDIKKPTRVKHVANLVINPSSEDFGLESLDYNGRVRSAKDIIITASGPAGTYQVHSNVGHGKGRKHRLDTTRMLEATTDVIVTTVGRDDPTTAEGHRAATIRLILQGAYDLLDNPWIRNIWFPPSDELLIWPEDWAVPAVFPTFTSRPTSMLPLNMSQRTAVNTMLSSSSNHHIALIQGPPGTGKTSVIASFVQLSIASGRTGIWIVAQSNVAVKNVAEKLIKVKFFDWKLLVSNDFYVDWHEHLYLKIAKKNLIKSENFRFVSKQLEGIPVIICTLSMLSNWTVKDRFAKIVPMNCLLVDEASQIEIGNFVTTFIDYPTLRKVCFIGDDKQLPPHGQEDIEDLQSIFEFPHLNKTKKLCFLNTQYRMPPHIGSFISQSVYGGILASDKDHLVQSLSPCKFIDAGGKESKSNTSFENKAECDAIIKLATILQGHERSYRIITPYLGQRELIENTMKKTPDLSWEDKCFSVDSFQGNEDDYIIISVVRSMDIGFLKNLRRTNVMLTRCKRGMFIVSTQKFCEGPGAESLVGKMAKGKVWIAARDIEKRLSSDIL